MKKLFASLAITALVALPVAAQESGSASGGGGAGSGNPGVRLGRKGAASGCRRNTDRAGGVAWLAREEPAARAGASVPPQA